MDVSFSRDTYHTYMVIAGDEIFDVDYEEKIMGNQQSSVLLPFHMQCVNGRKQYYYEITGKVDFRSCMEKRQVNATNLDSLIRCLVEVCRTVDEYLLNLNSILVSAEYLYVDIEMQQIYAAYIPGMQGDFTEVLKGLTAGLLENTNHKDKDGVLLAYALYRIVRQEDFTPGMLGCLLKQQDNRLEDVPIKPDEPLDFGKIESMHETLTDENVETVEEESTHLIGKGRFLKIGLMPIGGISLWMLTIVVYKSGYLQMVLDRIGLGLNDRAAALIMMVGILLFLLLGRLFGKKKRCWFEKKEKDQDIWEDLEPDNQENNGVYAFVDMSVTESDQTVVLSGRRGTIRLVSLNRNIAEDLVITKLPCILGNRQPDAAVVIGAIGISRKHAVMELLEDGIYLSDLHSTNGTFVNGDRLKGDEKRKLLFEDVIAFADVRFMYCGGEIN